jgi:hypothetical protein
VVRARKVSAASSIATAIGASRMASAVGVPARRRGAAVKASVASGVAVLVALAATWATVFDYGRSGGGLRPDHPTPARCRPVSHVTFIMRPTTQKNCLVAA